MRLWSRYSVGRAAAAIAIVMSLALAGCGDDDTDASGGAASTAPAGTGTVAGIPRQTGPLGPAVKDGSPVKGGVLRVSVANRDPGGLDPIKLLGSGNTGNTEGNAIFDNLVRYDHATNKWVPQMAESLTANADNSKWTIKLRSGVKFSDGTPVNSAAVKFSYERFSSPDSSQVYGSILPEIVSMETPDDLTVVVNLDGPDAEFPFVISLTFGNVVSPTAVKAQGAKAFNLNPVGAGPFTVKSYTPGTGLSLVRNPTYWGPAPNLDGIEFTWLDNDKAKADGIKSGDLDVVTLVDPANVKKSLDDGQSGFGWLSYGSPVVTMNMRQGHRFSDVRLRQAVAYALDADAVNARVFNGLGIASKDMFPFGKLSSGAKGLETSPDKARQLVQEVKSSTGWDGSFTLLASSEASAKEVALSVQAMLNNVGFKAVVETPPTWVTSVYVKFDFDITVTSLGFMETDPWVYLVYEAGGEYAPSGFKDPRMDAALIQLRGAKTEAETKAATKTMQEIWNQVIPNVFLGSRLDTMFQSSKLHGVVPTNSTILLFHQAWLSK